MRKKKSYPQAVKRIMRPELTHYLECQSKLQRCVTISDRMIITSSKSFDSCIVGIDVHTQTVQDEERSIEVQKQMRWH